MSSRPETMSCRFFAILVDVGVPGADSLAEKPLLSRLSCRLAVGAIGRFKLSEGLRSHF